LSIQHYKNFKERYKDLPCKVEYINRFKSSKQKKETLEKLAKGEIDVLIGTHALVGKDVKFKSLGLLIIDEEQKFGVSVKDKLKLLKENVDTLTLTATPIPRTLQFSLMGARDLSIINTPPPNRHPVQTEVTTFNEEVIRDRIMYEISRGGQVYFIHNRVQNILEIAGMLQRICPGIRIAVGHGQMDGEKLEEIMVGFIEGEYDLLLATAIIESGIDIPNANTILINDAHHFGLSDLHQLRGRVGRSNKRAFCTLLTQPMHTLTSEAKKRLQAIEQFSELGGGFSIAMRDLDIRGAGNLLGGEQSGFISDIGYETYMKILDEAVSELKETEFKDLYPIENQEEHIFVRECTIETDLEILIPDHYVNNVNERLILYRELDDLKNENDLLKFEQMMLDRFGPIPAQTAELFDTIRLRWIAREIGFEKLILKFGKLTGYFITNEQSPYYQTQTFSKVLKYLQHHHQHTKMEEKNNRLQLSVTDVRSVRAAIAIVQGIRNTSLS
jgi:transcription-repair coupling factor (superfamily II helicase)